MATSPDQPNPQSRRAMHPDREAVCPEHGPYLSRNTVGSIWTRCPACSQALEDRRRLAEAQEAAQRAEQRHRARLNAARIPARFIGRSFDHYVCSTRDQRAALTRCREFSESFGEARTKGPSLILSGKPGTGKSHLAAAILQAHLDRAVRYCTCLDMIRAVRDTWRRDSARSETDLLNRLERLDLLAIDEIGMQYGTEGEQTILFDVLDRRYRELKPTILITNQARDGLAATIGDRSFDRLREIAQWVAFDWESYRPVALRESSQDL